MYLIYPSFGFINYFQTEVIFLFRKSIHEAGKRCFDVAATAAAGAAAAAAASTGWLGWLAGLGDWARLGWPGWARLGWTGSLAGWLAV